MTTTFYFVRHGYSCANMYADKNKIGSSFKEVFGSGIKDPHLTNLGIIGSMMSGRYINDKLKDVTFDNCYCSPLIRTWETAACMFSDITDSFTVAPYLKEFAIIDVISQKIKYPILYKRR